MRTLRTLALRMSAGFNSAMVRFGLGLRISLTAVEEEEGELEEEGLKRALRESFDFKDGRCMVEEGAAAVRGCGPAAGGGSGSWELAAGLAGRPCFFWATT